MIHLLVVQPDGGFTLPFITDGESWGYRCTCVDCIRNAISQIGTRRFDAVLFPHSLDTDEKHSLIEALSRCKEHMPVMVAAPEDRHPGRYHLITLQAYDYYATLSKDSDLKPIIDRLMQFGAAENHTAKPAQDETIHLKEFVFSSSIMRLLAQNLVKIAQTDANVLIFGESGTGKEMIAKSIHMNSARKSEAFVPVDCVAYPENLLESELFGFEKGAFTGAHITKPGVLELAHGGTLFLDEIAEMDIHLQPKLLRVLQERQFRRIGGKKLIHVDMRVISATNRDPEAAVKDNLLREDLYYRLNVIPIYVPPLRDRKEDIPLLCHHFIEKYNPFASMEIRGITNAALQCMIQYPWPGNVRELENVIQRVVTLADGEFIDIPHLPENFIRFQEPDSDPVLLDSPYHEAKKAALAHFSRTYIRNLLRKHGGNISAAAKYAGVSRKTLYEIIAEYKIDYTTVT